MQINRIQDPIRPQGPAYKMNYSTKIRYDSEGCKRVIDTICLDNGKKLTITKAYCCNTLASKLQYLRDETGRWIKSKLRYYSGRRVARTAVSTVNDKEV